MDWESVSLVTRSKRRKKVLNNLYDGPKMPSTIRDQTAMHFSDVSEVLGELVEAGLAVRLNDDKKGRYYDITDDGKKVINYIQSGDSQ